eukprot:7098845-Prymnesium_polylepis.1
MAVHGRGWTGSRAAHIQAVSGLLPPAMEAGGAVQAARLPCARAGTQAGSASAPNAGGWAFCCRGRHGHARWRA